MTLEKETTYKIKLTQKQLDFLEAILTNEDTEVSKEQTDFRNELLDLMNEVKDDK